jgi:hypothetical protein
MTFRKRGKTRQDDRGLKGHLRNRNKKAGKHVFFQDIHSDQTAASGCNPARKRLNRKSERGFPLSQIFNKAFPG